MTNSLPHQHRLPPVISSAIMLITLLILTASCNTNPPPSSRNFNSPTSTQLATATPSPGIPNPALPESRQASPCNAFWAFDALINSEPPQHRQTELLASARQVQAAAKASRKFVKDANSLVADIARANFPQNGNVEDAPIQQMLADCSPGSAP
jgi:hypothetical protein